MKPNILFCLYLFVFGLLGCWSVYYILSSVTTEYRLQDIFFATFVPSMALFGLAIENRQSKE